MRRHQIGIFTSRPGKTWASCQTCGRCSKQGSKGDAEAWMVTHQDEAMSGKLDKPKLDKSSRNRRPKNRGRR